MVEKDSLGIVECVWYGLNEWKEGVGRDYFMLLPSASITLPVPYSLKLAELPSSLSS